MEQTDSSVVGSSPDAGAGSHTVSDGAVPADAGETAMPVDAGETQSSDASQPDGGAVEHDGSAPSFAIARPGAACSAAEAETLACDGHASRKSLKCSHGLWEVFSTCGEQERCQSRVGPLQGLCSSVPAACAGQTPETLFCSGHARLSCDIDLLTVSEMGCQPNAHCDPNTAALCSCDGEYEDDRAGGCRFANDCAQNPCVHGTCVDGVVSYSCQCEAGFVGTQCEVNIDDCAGGPCHNDGTCTDGVNTFTCSCAPGFDGPTCDTAININDCPANACTNGTCVDLENDYTCDCRPGYRLSASGYACIKDIIGCDAVDKLKGLHPNPVCP